MTRDPEPPTVITIAAYIAVLIAAVLLAIATGGA